MRLLTVKQRTRTQDTPARLDKSMVIKTWNKNKQIQSTRMFDVDRYLSLDIIRHHVTVVTSQDQFNIGGFSSFTRRAVQSEIESATVYFRSAKCHA